MSYKVTGAYVTVKVRDERGQLMTLGFYAGGVLPDSADQADVERLLRKGLLAEEGTPQADAAVPHGVPVTFDELGHAVPQETGQAEPAAEGTPKQSDTKAAWVDYAVTQGAERADAEAKSKAELVEQYG